MHVCDWSCSVQKRKVAHNTMTTRILRESRFWHTRTKGERMNLKQIDIKSHFTSRLMVNLTQPAVLCFQNEVPTDKVMRNYYIEIENDLQSYKEVRFPKFRLELVNNRKEWTQKKKQTKITTKIRHCLVQLNKSFVVLLQAFADEGLFGVLAGRLGELLQLVGSLHTLHWHKSRRGHFIRNHI